MNYIFLSLEDSLEYPFQDQDPVWIRTQGHNWVFGKVAGRNIRVGQTRYRREGFFYPVNFGSKFNLRKYFAPTNAEIKPDTEEVRQLLREEGWLDSGDSTVSDGSEYTE
ncbi:hypothetical protein BDZ97DRAFT_838572 [Flammula alnicola]|nr:hypothetical protein BDZ97DRAFT_838572 [Flammula alnicola]